MTPTGKPRTDSQAETPPTARERAQATQIDFVMSMGIRVFILGVVVAAAFTVVAASSPDDYSGRVTAKRSADRLAADLLTDEPNDVVLSRECTKAFFQEDTSKCGYNSEWANGDGDFLHDALAVSHEYRINTTVETPSGQLVVLDGEKLRAGPDPSEETDDTVHVWHRRRPLDVDNDGTARSYTIYVRIWEVG